MQLDACLRDEASVSGLGLGWVKKNKKKQAWMLQVNQTQHCSLSHRLDRYIGADTGLVWSTSDTRDKIKFDSLHVLHCKIISITFYDALLSYCSFLILYFYNHFMFYYLNCSHVFFYLFIFCTFNLF